MDRFGSIITAAGLGCFVFAFALSSLYPYLITGGSTPETNIAVLAQDVSDEFRDLKARWPVAFDAAYPQGAEALTLQQLLGVSQDDPKRVASEAAWEASYAQALRDGRDSYVSEGCWHCHSQYVRPVSNEDQRWGPVSVWEQDNNSLQRPMLWGTRRVGPDLTYEGGLRSNDWHAAHFWRPAEVSPGSVMPRYPWLFRDGWQVHRRIDPEISERTGLAADTSYALPGLYDSQSEAEAALQAARDGLPVSLAAESERLFVGPGKGLNHRGLSMLAYIQWLGTWMPEEKEPES